MASRTCGAKRHGPVLWATVVVLSLLGRVNEALVWATPTVAPSASAVVASAHPAPKSLLSLRCRGGGCPCEEKNLKYPAGCWNAHGIERMAPTPYPKPDLPAVPSPLWAGDLRLGGKGILPSPTPPGPPPPPLPPLPPVPLPPMGGVGMRFLPKLEMPKGPVTDKQDLDYYGNPVTREPPPEKSDKESEKKSEK
eukprot:gnl/TRDRNA2_/TRDRNA2_179901_c0_seq1.p1 gnl/TRDRNA2_/TRDRNA2_179901_c0~~gnl/TRDRNA2_/TRDRNA2_179901_c0_seq1.p1  ORF type:complete len:220 (-),score=18.05 gnl/TRDRNA2_/TRDRNA2_179901_c0_seq1:315-896(-)